MIETTEKKLGYFRSYCFKNPEATIKLCKHIEIAGVLIEDDDGCEYNEDIIITCKICDIKFNLTECVN